MSGFKRHELKCWPQYFKAVRVQRKTFELRRDDRGFETGHILRLMEWDPETKQYTGDWLERVVVFIIRNATEFGLQEGFCVMGIDTL